MARSTRKKSRSTKKTSRKRGKSRRRGMRGLGDLLSTRANTIAMRIAKTGKRPDPEKIERAAANSLCREGHTQYCEGRTARRAGRPARMAQAAYAKCVATQQQRAAMGLSPKPCKKPKTKSSRPRKAKAAAAVAEAPKPTVAKAQASETRAADKGCHPPKGRVCVDASVGKVGTKRRKGCVPGKPKGTFYCTPKAVSLHAAGKNIRAAGKRAPKGYHYVSLTKAINFGNGRFKPGCWAQTGAGKRATGKFICKSAPRKSRKAA